MFRGPPPGSPAVPRPRPRPEPSRPSRPPALTATTFRCHLTGSNGSGMMSMSDTGEPGPSSWVLAILLQPQFWKAVCAAVAAGVRISVARSSGRSGQEKVVQGSGDALPPQQSADQQFDEREGAAGMLGDDMVGQRSGQLPPPGGRRPERHSEGVPDQVAAVAGLGQDKAPAGGAGPGNGGRSRHRVDRRRPRRARPAHPPRPPRPASRRATGT